MVGMAVDLEFEILLRLPVKSLVRFRCVCKSWLSLITSPTFISQHLLLHTNTISNSNHYLVINGRKSYISSITRILSYETLGVLDARSFSPTYPHRLDHLHNHDFTNFWIRGCCNGLLLVYDHHLNYFLWNLATRETRLLPPCLSRRRDPPSFTNFVFETVGFGFDAESDDYKVVIMHELHRFGRDEWFAVEVYSLKTDCWRTIETTLSDSETVASIVRSPSQGCNGNGVFTEGIYSWVMVRAYKKKMEVGESIWDEIISFDLGKEVFVLTPLPDTITTSPLSLNCPLVFNHSLAVVNSNNIDNKVFDVWVLGEYGVKESWSKVFSIGPVQIRSRILGFWKDNKVLVESYDELFLYDLQTRRLDKHGAFGYDCKMLNYCETLVPIIAALHD